MLPNYQEITAIFKEAEAEIAAGFLEEKHGDHTSLKYIIKQLLLETRTDTSTLLSITVSNNLNNCANVFIILYQSKLLTPENYDQIVRLLVSGNDFHVNYFLFWLSTGGWLNQSSLDDLIQCNIPTLHEIFTAIITISDAYFSESRLPGFILAMKKKSPQELANFLKWLELLAGIHCLDDTLISQLANPIWMQVPIAAIMTEKKSGEFTAAVWQEILNLYSQENAADKMTVYLQTIFPNYYQFETLLTRKNINQLAFSNQLSLENNIEDHTAWAFENIYSIPYVAASAGKVARLTHGIHHNARTAAYIPILVNLRRHFGDRQALALTEREVRLLQIAMLFHDSAREDDNEDRWDHESALLFYFYLTKTLKLEKEEAQKWAEAVANKDYNPSKNYYCLVDNNGKYSWQESNNKPQEKPLIAKLIHDADCLDIIRATPQFISAHLDFYQDFVIGNINFEKNIEALNIITSMTKEIRRLINTQGDAYKAIIPEIKLAYECHTAYQKIINSLQQSSNTLMKLFFNNGILFTPAALPQRLPAAIKFDKNKPLTPQNLQAALDQGQVFSRSIEYPSFLVNKDKYGPESRTELERRKMLRRPDPEMKNGTRTQKPNRFTKNGNPHRSISMLGWGAKPFSDAGILIVGLEEKDIEYIGNSDLYSGKGKKNHNCFAQQTGEEIRHHRERVLLECMLGTPSKDKRNLLPSEFIYRIKKADAIYYTTEPSAYSCSTSHPNSQKLQAIYIQKSFASQGIHLPIYHYSWRNNALDEEKIADDDTIVTLWSEMVRSYYQENFYKNYSDESLDDIKINAMYLPSTEHCKKGAADSNYSPTLRKRVDKAIINIRQGFLEKHKIFVREQLNKNKDKLLNKSVARPLIFHTEYFIEFKDLISEYLTQNMSPEIFARVIDRWLEDTFPLLDLENSPIMNAYRLAEEFNLPHAKQFKQAATEKIAAHLTALQKQLNPNFCQFFYRYELQNLLKIIQLFGLTETFRNEVNALLNLILAGSVEKVSYTQEALTEFSALVQLVKQQGYEVNPQIVSQILSRFQHTLFPLEENKDYQLFSLYLKLEIHNSAPANSLLKPQLLQWLKLARNNAKFLHISQEIMLLCDSPTAAIKSFFADAEIVSAMIENISFFGFFNNEHVANPAKLLFHLERLKALLPEQQFTAKQQQLIDRRFLALTYDFLAQLTKSQGEAPDAALQKLLFLVNHLHSLTGFPRTLPAELLITFEKFLQDAAPFPKTTSDARRILLVHNFLRQHTTEIVWAPLLDKMGVFADTAKCVVVAPHIPAQLVVR